MKAFTTLGGTAAPLPRENIDTDIIIPMSDMLSVPRSGLGKAAFRPLRYHDDGTENPEFVFNKPQFREAEILVTGRNFGCGSSREMAVYAIEGMGIRVLIGTSFGDIFYNNCIKNGILPVVLDEAGYGQVLDAVTAADGAHKFLVDLPQQRIVLPDQTHIAFDIEPGHKARLLDGRDEISLTLERDSEIAAFQKADHTRRPWVWQHTR